MAWKRERVCDTRYTSALLKQKMFINNMMFIAQGQASVCAHITNKSQKQKMMLTLYTARDDF